jgi:soluble lytic murein transglycosylase-like protein
MVVILLVSGAAGFAGRAHAEPAVAAQPQNASAADPYASFFNESAQRFGVPASWISIVMAMESDADVRALSSQGAIGLMQIMPDTWANLGARHRLGADPYGPRDNLLAGAQYLREMLDR